MSHLTAYEHFDFHAVRENICWSRTTSKRKEQDTEKKMCRLVGVEYGLRLNWTGRLNLNKCLCFCASVSKFLFSFTFVSQYY